jgi:hypothetical protein
MSTVRLDVTFEEGLTLGAAVEPLIQGLDVVWQDTGLVRGGGWPEVEFSGERAALVALIERYCANDNSDAAWFATLIDA